MPNNMTYGEYKKLSNEEKELHNFEFSKRMMNTVEEACSHAKETNGRVKRLELWRSMILGALVILGTLFPYLTFIK